MNAVNLIPADRRKRSLTVPVSPLTLGVIGGLVVVLVAAVVYVFAVNDVRARKSELASVTANAASWQAAASSYASYVTAAQQQKQQLADIQQLVTGRFPWSVLLSQIGGVMPDDAALSSLQATSPSAAGASAAAGTTSSSTETSQPIQITGCAASQSAVAATMIALGRVQGVSSVALSSTTGSATSSTSASARSGSSSNGCPFPVSFSLSLLLASPSTTGTASGTASGATAPTSTATTPAATAAASTATTPSTASAQ
jgi:Tfp pilus assembly protein PilN